MSSTLPKAILMDPNEGCLTMARSLSRRGVDVHVLAGPSSAFVARSRYVTGWVGPPLPMGHPEWVGRLDELASGGDGVLICGSDAASELLCQQRTSISSALRSFEGPTSAHLKLMDKAQLYAIAREAGLRTPWMVPVRTRSELVDAAASVDFPCIVKPAVSHRGRDITGFKALLVTSAAQLTARGAKAVDSGVQLLVTEFVPGGERNLEGAVTIRAADGSYPLAYGRRKIRQHPIGFGVGSLNCSADVPLTLAMAKRLLDYTDFVGVSGLEAKRHAVTGEAVLIEINVRVVQSYAVGQVSGTEAAWRLYATLAGIRLGPQPQQRQGVKVVIPHLDFLTVRTRLASRQITVRELLSSYRGTRDVGVLDPRDPLPAISLAGRLTRSNRAKRRAPQQAAEQPTHAASVR